MVTGQGHFFCNGVIMYDMRLHAVIMFTYSQNEAAGMRKYM